jgi:glyoxylate reductase
MSNAGLPRVIVTHPLPEEALRPLASLANLHILAPEESLAQAAADSGDAAGVLCLLTDPVDAALVAQLPQLKFVSSVSVGVDHVDVAALTARAIPLGHTPGVLVEATADTAFALLLAAGRRIVEADRFVRAGHWREGEPWSPDFFLGKDLAGATLGIVGLGAIGQAVARRAQAFGLSVLGWTPSGRAVEGVTSLPLDEVLARSDFVSVHVALAQATRNLIDAQKLALMKPGAVLVNTARGGIVDETALCDALERGHLFAAGLDVYATEPLPRDHRLFQQPSVVLAPHIGSATGRTRADMVRLAVANAVAALQAQPMPHCVNPEVYAR